MIDLDLLDSLRAAINLIKEKQNEKVPGLEKVIEQLEDVKNKLEDKNKKDGEET